VLSGLSLGSAQSAGRALVGVLTPSGKAAEFFGFWGLLPSWRLFSGFLVWALSSGRWDWPMPSCSAWCSFVLAMVTVLPLNEARGRAAAEGWRDSEEVA